jgi:hypothetical protein
MIEFFCGITFPITALAFAIMSERIEKILSNIAKALENLNINSDKDEEDS